jgi:putative membrane protein
MTIMMFGGWAWLVLLALVVIIWFALRKNGNMSNAGRSQMGSASPMNVLEMRYARGELTKEQFDKMKRDLKS